MGGFGYITSVVVAAAAFGCSGYVYFAIEGKANVTPHELAPLLAAVITTAVGFLVAVAQAVAYFAYYRDDLKAWRLERWKKAGPQLHTLMEQIRREQRNLDQLQQGNPPKGGFSEHTEVTPFEQLTKTLKPIEDLSGYRRVVRLLLAETARVQAMPRGSKDVSRFMPLLDRLKAKLEPDVKGRPKSL